MGKVASMTDDQADQTVPKTVQFAFQNSAVFIAIGTLWLYLVATSYADGYLNFFGLGIAWFDVTPFRLLGFGYLPVLAVVVVTAIWWLVMASPMSERNPAMWCVVLSLWSAIVVAHAVVRSAAQVAKQDLPLLDIWGYLPRVAFECAVYVLLPLVVFLFFRYYLETHRIPRLWADWKATADALKSTLGETKTAVEKAKGTPEAERDFA